VTEIEVSPAALYRIDSNYVVWVQCSGSGIYYKCC